MWVLQDGSHRGLQGKDRRSAGKKRHRLRIRASLRQFQVPRGTQKACQKARAHHLAREGGIQDITMGAHRDQQRQSGSSSHISWRIRGIHPKLPQRILLQAQSKVPWVQAIRQARCGCNLPLESMKEVTGKGRVGILTYVKPFDFILPYACLIDVSIYCLHCFRNEMEHSSSSGD